MHRFRGTEPWPQCDRHPAGQRDTSAVKCGPRGWSGRLGKEAFGRSDPRHRGSGSNIDALLGQRWSAPPAWRHPPERCPHGSHGLDWWWYSSPGSGWTARDEGCSEPSRGVFSFLPMSGLPGHATSCSSHNRAGPVGFLVACPESHCVVHSAAHRSWRGDRAADGSCLLSS